MKLMPALVVMATLGALSNGTALANTLHYDIDDVRNCATRHVQQGESIDFAVRTDGSQDGSMIVVSTTNISAQLYRDGKDISDLLEPYITVDTFVEGVVAYLDTAGDYRLVTTSSGQGSVCVARPS